MTTILLIDYIEGYTESIKQYCLDKYQLDNINFNIEYIHNLPYYESYSVAHIEGKIISSYWGLKDSTTYVDDVEDITMIGDMLASEFINPKVWFTDDPNTAAKWLTKLPDVFGYDTETEGLRVKDIGKYTMHSFSLDIIRSFVIIDTPETRKIILDFLVSTTKHMVIHNAVFDLRPVYRFTGKYPKYYEDSMLLAQAYMNHTGVQAYSLKTLAGNLYGDWASAKEDFNLFKDSSNYINENLVYIGKRSNVSTYNLPLIYYAGIDSSAALHVFSKFSELDPKWKSISIENLLPIEEPRYHEETPRFFYENVLKPLVKVNIELLETPMPIDMHVVEEIKQEAISQREPAYQKLREFTLVKEYMQTVRNKLITDFLQSLQDKKAKWPIKEYKHTPKDRTIVMNYITKESKNNWKIKEIQQYLKNNPMDIIQSILNKDDSLKKDPTVIKLMSEYRSVNQQKLEYKLTHPLEFIPAKQLEINPNAATQMRGLYKYIGLESDVLTPKKEESFNKEVITEIAKTTSDTDIRNIIEQVLLIADTKNLLAQYIPAYETSNKDGFCWQSCKIPGTISMRISGAVGKVDKDNIFSEPLAGYGVSMCTQPGITKKVVVAPKGFIIATSDYNGLENNISANLTKDPTQIKVLVDHYDMHMLHASYYFREEVEAITGKPFIDTYETNQELDALRKVNKDLNKLRSAGKRVTFGISYGAYPPKISKSLKQPLEVGQALFDRFHNELYPTVKDYREEYILPTATENGKVHMGLGIFLKSQNPDKDIRTLSNATIQFWSILTLLAIHKVKQRIKQANLEDSIFIYSTIHDSISAYVKDDLDVIKWYNDNLIDCMTTNFIKDQSVPLQANLDIGRVYSNCVELPNNCSIDVIKSTLNKL